jgi:hypothetical protein
VSSLNIFSHSATPYGPEDKFTGHLAYLFQNIPALGQEWLNHLRSRGGLEPDTFESAGKHADGIRTSMPDFLMHGVREDILCEHKLDAPLGPQQLERYLDFARGRGRKTRLALVTGSVAYVPSALLLDGDYVRPNEGPLGYFRWEEFYPIVASRSEGLAREFTIYMEELGLRPCDTREWSDLFTNPARANDFAPQWADVARHFKTLGATVIRYKSRTPALLIKGPQSWLRQLYLKPVPRTSGKVESMRGPYLSARVAIDGDQASQAVLAAPERQLVGTAINVLSRPAARVRGEGDWSREYLTPLDVVVSAEPEIMRKRLLDFATVAFHDVMTLAERTSDTV